MFMGRTAAACFGGLWLSMTPLHAIEQAVRAFDNKDYAAAHGRFQGIADGRISVPATVGGSNLDAMRSGLNAAMAPYTAKSYLARMYLEGLGVNRDEARGVQLLRDAASRNGGAMYQMGKLHEEGAGVPRDPMQAMDWYERAHRYGDLVEGASRIAQMHDEAIGVPQNYAEAARWYRIAAEDRSRPDIHAMGRLGQMYLEGLGVTADEKQGLALLERAGANGHGAALLLANQIKAQKGDPRAMADIGAAYLEGRYVQQNAFGAHVWLSLALKHAGDNTTVRDQARRALPMIEQYLTPEQLADSARYQAELNIRP